MPRESTLLGASRTARKLPGDGSLVCEGSFPPILAFFLGTSIFKYCGRCYSVPVLGINNLENETVFQIYFLCTVPSTSAFC